ncbi:GPI inositol-deacylase [Phytophthora palmivora]|uniref:GPI inositol-deacylase n=1 Tax=Phytophthora palmivora TaxID=4796 RepID=A0A2P4WYR2_9STRA|nr:GPI inositol-deacylase [Phytophthora palmivora]
MVSLICAIVGAPSSSFRVDIDQNKLVSHLKTEIKKDNPATITCDAKDLQLFLAKKDNEWVKADDLVALQLKRGEIHDVRKVTAEEELDAAWKVEEVLIANDMRAPESKQIHVLVVLPGSDLVMKDMGQLEILIQVSAALRKMVSLICAIVGAPSSSFHVDIDQNKLVSHLKTEIKKDNPATITCDAKDLQLFLAKKDNEWVKADDLVALQLKRGEIHDVRKATAEEELNDTWKVEEVLIANDMRAPESKQIHVLVVLPGSVVLTGLYVSDMVSTKKYESACEMTWSWPVYSPVTWRSVPSHPKYALYRVDMKLARESLSGVPVLFVPGHLGSYKQARSLSRHLWDADETLFDVFALDFDEEPTGLNGNFITDQATYLNDVVRAILREYKRQNKKNKKHTVIPDSVVIVAHSMGGIVARTAELLPNYKKKSIQHVVALESLYKVVDLETRELVNNPNVRLAIAKEVLLGGEKGDDNGDFDTAANVSLHRSYVQDGYYPSEYIGYALLLPQFLTNLLRTKILTAIVIMYVLALQIFYAQVAQQI